MVPDDDGDVYDKDDSSFDVVVPIESDDGDVYDKDDSSFDVVVPGESDDGDVYDKDDSSFDVVVPGESDDGDVYYKDDGSFAVYDYDRNGQGGISGSHGTFRSGYFGGGRSPDEGDESLDGREIENEGE